MSKIILVIIILTFFIFSQTYQSHLHRQYQEELKQQLQELKIEQNELREELKKIHGEMVSAESCVSEQSTNRTEQEIDDIPIGVPGVKKEISWYSELDSCHNRTPEGCLTASGKIAKIGMVATWLYPIGTKLEIDGKIYTVEDRTKKELGHRIDIWTGMGKEAHQLALLNGIQYKKVKVIN